MTRLTEFILVALLIGFTFTVDYSVVGYLDFLRHFKAIATMYLRG